jgi:hypothetical protein
MTTLFGIAGVIAALAAPILAFYYGRACLTWARRCDPKNPSFRSPDPPGRSPRR